MFFDKVIHPQLFPCMVYIWPPETLIRHREIMHRLEAAGGNFPEPARSRQKAIYAQEHRRWMFEGTLQESLVALKAGRNDDALLLAVLVRRQVSLLMKLRGRGIHHMDPVSIQELLRVLGLSTYYIVRTRLEESSKGCGPVWGKAFGVRTTWYMLLLAFLTPPPTPLASSWPLPGELQLEELWQRTIGMLLFLYQLLQPGVYNSEILAWVIHHFSYMTAPQGVRQLDLIALRRWHYEKSKSASKLVALAQGHDAKIPGNRPSSAQALFRIIYAHFERKLQRQLGPEPEMWVMEWELPPTR